MSQGGGYNPTRPTPGAGAPAPMTPNAAQSYQPGQYGNFALARQMAKPMLGGTMPKGADGGDFGPRPPWSEPSGNGMDYGQNMQNTASGSPWNGLDRQILSGSGSLDLNPAMLGPGGLNFNMTGVGQGANPMNQYRGWLTDSQGNIVAGDPNKPFAGLGNLNASGLNPLEKYKFNYAGSPGQQFALSGNIAQQGPNTNTGPLLDFLAKQRAARGM